MPVLGAAGGTHSASGAPKKSLSGVGRSCSRRGGPVAPGSAGKPVPAGSPPPPGGTGDPPLPTGDGGGGLEGEGGQTSGRAAFVLGGAAGGRRSVPPRGGGAGAAAWRPACPACPCPCPGGVRGCGGDPAAPAPAPGEPLHPPGQRCPPGADPLPGPGGAGGYRGVPGLPGRAAGKSSASGGGGGGGVKCGISCSHVITDSLHFIQSSV